MGCDKCMLVLSPITRTESRRRNIPFARRRMTGQHRVERGFSLLELMIALSIALIVGATSFIIAQTTARSFRLYESSTSYANLLQTARIRAAQDDRYYTVKTATPSIGAPFAYVDIAGTGIYAAGDPMMVFGLGVAPMTFASGPSLTNLKSQFLPPGPTAQNSVNAASGPTFGPRGLPCTVSAGTCPYLNPTSYITFVQNTQSGKWNAITVTPAGRIRIWGYDGTTSTWSPLN
jgi:prepilin-type N-terminal cleavage/methylation domain-containing protein